MGGLEPPTPAFGGQCSIQLSYTDESATEQRVAIGDCKPIRIDRRGAEGRCFVVLPVSEDRNSVFSIRSFEK
jgi:hypothetical protein